MKNHMYNQEYGKLNYLLPTLMIIGPRKCLILSTFGATFQLSITPPKNSLTRYPPRGLRNYDMSLLLKKKSVELANMFGKYSCWNLAFAFWPWAKIILNAMKFLLYRKEVTFFPYKVAITHVETPRITHLHVNFCTLTNLCFPESIKSA